MWGALDLHLANYISRNVVFGADCRYSRENRCNGHGEPDFHGDCTCDPGYEHSWFCNAGGSIGQASLGYVAPGLDSVVDSAPKTTNGGNG